MTEQDPKSVLDPAKRDMVEILRVSQHLLGQLSKFAQHGHTDAARDWAERFGTMHMALAYASIELSRAIVCFSKGDFVHADLRAKAFDARLQRAIATLDDEAWAKWKGGTPPTSPVVTINQSNGAANDSVSSDDEPGRADDE